MPLVGRPNDYGLNNVGKKTFQYISLAAVSDLLNKLIKSKQLLKYANFIV